MVEATLFQLGGIVGKLVWNIVTVMGILVFAIAIFFITRFVQKKSKKAKAFNIQAVIVDLNGVIDWDTLAFVKSDDTGLLEMNFKIRKLDSIPPIPKHLIRNGIVMLLNYAPGHYCVIDTSKTINLIDQGKIVPFNLGMKKYIVSKQREIMNKAEDKKKKFEQYAPWITLGLGLVFVVVLCAFLYYFGVNFFNDNIAKRLEECKNFV